VTKQLWTMVWVSVLGAGTVACGDSTGDGDGESSEGGGGDTGSGAAGTGGAGGGVMLECAESDSQADCATMCAAVVAAECPEGPTEAQCESQCADLNDYVGTCPAWGGVVDCMGPAPTYTCMGSQPVPAGCEGEFYCLSQCFDD